MYRNYLSAFKKVIALPVDLVSSAATTIASPFQKGGSKNSDDPRKSLEAPSPVSPQSTTPPATPKVVTTLPQEEPHSPNSPSSIHSRQSLKSPDGRGIDLSSALRELDMLQDLLSLEMVLQLIHVNKDSERRVERFIEIGFPGRMRKDM